MRQIQTVKITYVLPTGGGKNVGRGGTNVGRGGTNIGRGGTNVIRKI